MIQLPTPPESPNVRALAFHYRETFTGLTSDTVTLAYTPVRTVNDVGLESVTLNGQRLSAPDDYAIEGKVITLVSPFGPLVVDDVVEVLYPYRAG